MKNKIKGQALISLLVFMIIAITVTTGAVFLLISNSINTTKIARGNNSLTVAEAGAENALINLLRDTSYTGETLSVENGEAEVTVTGTNPYLVISKGTDGDFSRTVEVSVEFVNNEMRINSWKEVY